MSPPGRRRLGAEEPKKPAGAVRDGPAVRLGCSVETERSSTSLSEEVSELGEFRSVGEFMVNRNRWIGRDEEWRLTRRRHRQEQVQGVLPGTSRVASRGRRRLSTPFWNVVGFRHLRSAQLFDLRLVHLPDRIYCKYFLGVHTEISEYVNCSHITICVFVILIGLGKYDRPNRGFLVGLQASTWGPPAHNGARWQVSTCKRTR